MQRWTVLVHFPATPIKPDTPKWLMHLEQGPFRGPGMPINFLSLSKKPHCPYPRKTVLCHLISSGAIATDVLTTTGNLASRRLCFIFSCWLAKVILFLLTGVTAITLLWLWWVSRHVPSLVIYGWRSVTVVTVMNPLRQPSTCCERCSSLVVPDTSLRSGVASPQWGSWKNRCNIQTAEFGLKMFNKCDIYKDSKGIYRWN